MTRPESIAFASSALATLMACGAGAPHHFAVGADAGETRDGSPAPHTDAAPPVEGPVDAGSGASDGGRPRGLAFQTLSAPLDEGGRATFELTVSPPDILVALRVTATGASGPSCLQLEQVAVSGEDWVGPATVDDYGDYCRTCAQRVSAGFGFGSFVLPSGPVSTPAFGSMRLVAARYDCLTLTPAGRTDEQPSTLTLELAHYAPPPDDARLTLPVALFVATEHGFPARDELDAALALVRDVFAAANIDVVAQGPTAIAAPAAPVTFDALDRGALDALDAAARALGAGHVGPRVVFTPCLIRQDRIGGGRAEPRGFTPHVPAGVVRGESSFVAVERCAGLEPGPSYADAADLGALIAHEIGHYLGLYHVVEGDGREDPLADTSESMPNLLQRVPGASAVALSAQQIAVVRRHPVFAR